MSVIAPPRPPDTRGPHEARALEALIEEARRRARRRRRRLGAILILTFAGGLATYAGVGGRGDDSTGDVTTPPRGEIAFGKSAVNGLTIFLPPTSNRTIAPADVARIVNVGPRPRVIWSCPGGAFCGQAVSHDWAPDGKRFAIALDELGGSSTYPLGLHIVDASTGRDRHIPQIPGGWPDSIAGWDGWPAHDRTIKDRLGCWPPTDLDWSPDGSRIVYRCSSMWGGGNRINVIRLDGSGFTTVPIPGPAFWPSWSGDGTRIVYATKLKPGPQSAIYVVGLDGSNRRRLAGGGSAPAWSPDGHTIAYQVTCGIRLVTPTGRDITPRGAANRCGAIGPTGRPAWSPDGSRIAIEAAKGIYVINADGNGLHLVSRTTSTAWYGRQPGRPSWRHLP